MIFKESFNFIHLLVINIENKIDKTSDDILVYSKYNLQKMSQNDRTNTSNIVYMRYKHVMIYMKLLDDTITNENRKGIYDSQYAKYRCNKVLIYSISTLVKPYDIIDSISDGNYVYEIGKVIQTNDINTGFEYFKTYDGAYYYMAPIPSSGDYKIFDINGRKLIDCKYENGSIICIN